MRFGSWLQPLFENEAAGAGEGAGGGASGGDAGGSSPAAPAAESSGSGYSAVDPGYTPDESDEEPADELAALKAENAASKETPAGDEPADAGSDAEESSDAKAESTNESAGSEDDFSEALLDRAVALGYTVADIKSFRSEKSLEKEISRVERLQQRMASRQAPATEQQQEAAETQAASEPDWQKMLDEGYDPQMVAFQQQSWQRAVAAEQRAMQAESAVQQLHHIEQQRAFDAQVQRFDSTLANLGEEYESLFGKGSMAEVKKASPEAAQKRVEVFQKFQQLKNAYLMNKQPLPPEQELIEEAVHARFWKQTKSLARKELTNDIKKAGSQALSRPRSTGRQSLSGAPAALAKEQDFWKKFS